MRETDMTSIVSDYHRQWSVILAGQEFSSLDPFITLWQGAPTPKQYCAFAGTRSLLQHTWDLADQFSHPENKVTVVTQPFSQQTFRQFGGRVPGVIAIEPFHKGSLASALLGLAAVRAQDPHSTIVLYPSQSFMYPAQQFLRTIQQAVRAATLLRNRVVLLGASSEHSVGKYGWLCPTTQLGWISGLPVHAVEMNPTPTFPASSIEDQASPPSLTFYNSGIVLAQTEILWNLCELLFPVISQNLESLGDLTGRPEKQNQKTLAFQQLPSGCFWKDFLSKIPNHLSMIKMQGVTWSDWENPKHIADTLSILGKKHAFPTQWLRQNDERPPVFSLKQEIIGQA
jgi:mannose-1-phosphate guanylyltransferase